MKTTWPISRASRTRAKLVTTIKAPHGRHRARVVICGNMLTAMNGDKEQTPVDKKDNYASGVDGTAIRCVLRKAAHEKWGIAAVDVKGAFLLAPRKETRRTTDSPASGAVWPKGKVVGKGSNVWTG